MLQFQVPKGTPDYGPREELFSVGDNKYTLPVKCPLSLAMGYATVNRQFGSEMATSWALEMALGEAGLNALLNSDPSDSDLVKIISVVLGRIQGIAVPVPDPDPKEVEEPDPKA